MILLPQRRILPLPASDPPHCSSGSPPFEAKPRRSTIKWSPRLGYFSFPAATRRLPPLAPAWATFTARLTADHRRGCLIGREAVSPKISKTVSRYESLNPLRPIKFRPERNLLTKLWPGLTLCEEWLDSLGHSRANPSSSCHCFPRTVFEP